MKRALPKEQDKMLKELKELEDRSTSELSPERNYILTGLGILSTFSFICIGINDYYSNHSFYLAGIIVLWVLLSFAIILSLLDKRFGAVLASIIALSMNLGLSYILYINHSPLQSLSLFADIFVIWLITSNFGNGGYLLSTVLLIVKNFYFQIYLGTQINYLSILVDTIIILVTGTFLLMIMYLFRIAENSRMQTIRAEILALQNQELIGSWEGFFKK